MTRARSKTIPRPLPAATAVPAVVYLDDEGADTDPSNVILGNPPRWARDLGENQRYTLQLLKSVQGSNLGIATDIGIIRDELRSHTAQLAVHGKDIVELKRTDKQLAADLQTAEGSLVSRVTRLEAEIKEIKAAKPSKRPRRAKARR